jgi:Tol biopolymer transport system component
VSRVTPPGVSVWSMAWHPDGRSLAVSLTYADERGQPAGLFLVSASGTFPPQRLTQPPADLRHSAPSWNADGRVLFYSETAEGRSEIFRIQDGGTPERVLAGESRLSNQTLSPDGRWLAYASNESGQAEVYIRPYPSVMDDRIIVSSGGGSLPMWGRDGRELLYVTPDRTLVAVPVTPGPPLSLGRAEVRTHLQGATGTFAISPDGARVMTTARPSAQGPIANEFRVVLDLIGELKRSAR